MWLCLKVGIPWNTTIYGINYEKPRDFVGTHGYPNFRQSASRCFAPAVISERSDVQSRSRSGCTAEPDPPLLYSGPPSQT